MPGEGRGAQGQPGRPSPNAGAGTTRSISRPGFHLAFALNFKSGWKSVWSDNPRLIHLQVHTRVHTGIVSFRCAVSLSTEVRFTNRRQDPPPATGSRLAVLRCLRGCGGRGWEPAVSPRYAVDFYFLVYSFLCF